ncbi:MAG TPA: hypothetical protein VJ732_09360 [Bryobacteraceae bacterium]|nr:hypothetical protein [Bryobacteraceae bacterium]
MRTFRLAMIIAVGAAPMWWARAQSLDPLVVDPGHYHLDLQNQWVRVIREHMTPHDTMPMHQHPEPGAVIVFFTARHNRLTSPQGVSQELRDPAEKVMWSPASTHRSENLSDAPFEAVQIEPKVPAHAALSSAFSVGKRDATVVDPKHYQVVLENEYVRVIRVTIGPHEKLAMHVHPATGAVLVHLTDQNLRLTFADGTTRETHYAARQIHWAAPAQSHQDENLSGSPLRFIRVELKMAAGGEVPSN